MRRKITDVPWRTFCVLPTAARTTARALVHAVDLRLLQLVGVIHVDCLPLGVEVNRADAAFAVTVAGGLGAAERKVYLGANSRSIDVGDAGVKVAHRSECLVHVFGVERRR